MIALTRSPEAIALLGHVSLDSYDFGQAGRAAIALRAINPDSREADLLDARSLLLQRQPLKAQPFVFVICDIGRPILSGIDLLKAVRTDASLRHLPVLMVTAEARKEDIVLAMQCGAAGYLVKPFTVAALEERVKKALRDHASAA